MPHLVRSLLLLTSALILVACATQKGVIDRPDWAETPAHWDGTGLSVASYSASEYSTNAGDEAQLAEENALREARKMVSRELAKAYVAYKSTQKETVSEEDAAYQLERQLGNIVSRQRHYDEQRRVFFIQLYLPSHRIQELISATFGVQVTVGADGKLQ